MAKAKTTPGTKSGRTKANSNPLPESGVNPGTGAQQAGQIPANDTAMTKNVKGQAANPQSVPGSRVPASDVVIVASGSAPVEAGRETQPVTESKVRADAKSEPAKPSVETKSAPEPRKLEVVKTDSRKNTVVPINLEDEIRRRADELYVQRGSIGGSEAEDWLRAEREVRQRYQKQQSA